MTITISSIVEGHSEVISLPILFRRIGEELGISIIALKPIRISEDKIKNKKDSLQRYVSLAAEQISEQKPGFVFILTDADDEEDCPARLGPQILALAQQERPDASISVVLAKREYEGWFLAAAESLRGKRGLPDDLAAPDFPENIRDAKGWLGSKMGGYSETRDQPAFSAIFDLHQAKARSASFAKMWREIEKQRTILLEG